MTEKEKMLAGKIYDPSDKALVGLGSLLLHQHRQGKYEVKMPNADFDLLRGI